MAARKSSFAFDVVFVGRFLVALSFPFRRLPPFRDNADNSVAKLMNQSVHAIHFHAPHHYEAVPRLTVALCVGVSVRWRTVADVSRIERGKRRSKTGGVSKK